MKLVVDTSVLIDHFRGGNIWKKIVRELAEDVELLVPTIVIFELFSGETTKDSVIISKIYKLLDNFCRIDLDEEIAKRAGELFRDIKKTMQVPDYVIAASALEIRGVVVTLNKKHFEQIPGLNLYLPR